MSSLWKHVKSEWFYTKQAAFVFTTSAILVFILIAGSEFVPVSFASLTTYSTGEQIGFAIAGVTFSISNLLVLSGMFRFSVVCDQSRPIMRRIWFVIMIVGLLRLGLGAAVYCFAVYLPQITKRLRSETFGA